MCGKSRHDLNVATFGFVITVDTMIGQNIWENNICQPGVLNRAYTKQGIAEFCFYGLAIVDRSVWQLADCPRKAR